LDTSYTTWVHAYFKETVMKIVLVLFLVIFENITVAFGTKVSENNKAKEVDEEEYLRKLYSLSSDKAKAVIVFKENKKIGEFEEKEGEKSIKGLKTFRKLDNLFDTCLIEMSSNIYADMKHSIVVKDGEQSMYLGVPNAISAIINELESEAKSREDKIIEKDYFYNEAGPTSPNLKYHPADILHPIFKKMVRSNNYKVDGMVAVDYLNFFQNDGISFKLIKFGGEDVTENQDFNQVFVEHLKYGNFKRDHLVKLMKKLQLHDVFISMKISNESNELSESNQSSESFDFILSKEENEMKKEKEKDCGQIKIQKSDKKVKELIALSSTKLESVVVFEDYEKVAEFDENFGKLFIEIFKTCSKFDELFKTQFIEAFEEALRSENIVLLINSLDKSYTVGAGFSDFIDIDEYIDRLKNDKKKNTKDEEYYKNLIAEVASKTFNLFGTSNDLRTELFMHILKTFVEITATKGGVDIDYSNYFEEHGISFKLIFYSGKDVTIGKDEELNSIFSKSVYQFSTLESDQVKDDYIAVRNGDLYDIDTYVLMTFPTGIMYLFNPGFDEKTMTELLVQTAEALDENKKEIKEGIKLEAISPEDFSLVKLPPNLTDEIKEVEKEEANSGQSPINLEPVAPIVNGIKYGGGGIFSKSNEIGEVSEEEQVNIDNNVEEESPIPLTVPENQTPDQSTNPKPQLPINVKPENESEKPTTTASKLSKNPTPTPTPPASSQNIKPKGFNETSEKSSASTQILATNKDLWSVLIGLAVVGVTAVGIIFVYLKYSREKQDQSV
jgi:hypothetical protein